MAQATIQRGPVSGTAAASANRRRAPFFITFYRSAVGKKYVMAITGIIGMGFVLVHMIGNLKMFLGQAELNHYGEFLRELLVPILPRTVVLWLLRIGLIVALLLHLHAAYSLTVMNHKARPVKYQSHRDYVAADFASRTMRWSGIIVLLFLVFHLADLTWGWFNPDFIRGDAVPQRGGKPVSGARGDPLHRRQHRAGHPPVPRRLEPLPVDRVPTVRASTSGGGGSPRPSPRSSSSATCRCRWPSWPGS